jgi:hypothetical protein
MDGMKRLVFVLGFSGALLCSADLPGVRNLYVMPMSRGLDQYLASRITSEHLFQVVTDPKLADAVLSDRVGESLQTQLETIFPTPKPPETEPAEKADADQPAAKSEKSSKHAKDKEESSSATPSMFQDTVNKLDNPAQTSTFGRSKGNIFLVDTKSRQVIWSTYDPPKGSATRDLDRTASDIVSRLKKDLYPKKK